MAAPAPDTAHVPVRPEIEAALRRAAERMIGEVLAILAEAGPVMQERAPGPRRRMRRRAHSLERLAAEVLATLSTRDGVSVGDIARALGAEARELTRPLTWLLQRGQVRRTGERRGARYFVTVPVPEARAPRDAGEARARRDVKKGKAPRAKRTKATAAAVARTKTRAGPASRASRARTSTSTRRAGSGGKKR